MVYDLLTSDEQQLFARLSVFAGGCTLEAAEEVAEADLDTLQSLVDKSLLRFTKARYWLLETIREFAIERLVERGGQTALQQRHLCHLREWVEQVNPQLKGAEQLECLDRLEADHDNFRAALEHGLRGLGDPVEAGRLAAGLLEFWDMRSHYEEARRWFADVFDRRDQIETGMVAEALRGAGLAAYRQGNEGEAVELYLEALTAYEAAMDLRGQSRSWVPRLRRFRDRGRRPGRFVGGAIGGAGHRFEGRLDTGLRVCGARLSYGGCRRRPRRGVGAL